MRPAPARLERLPEQFFTRILASAAQVAAQEGPPLVDLGRGNPDLPPPPAAVEALRRAAARTPPAGIHGYPPFQGLPALREALAARYRRDHGVELDPDTQVAVLPGTKTGIMLATLATAERGRSVVLPDPGYPDYRSGVALAGAREVRVRLRADAGFAPDLDEVAADDAALLVLNYPSNPCAVCEPPGTFERALAWTRERGAVLLHDLAYGFLAYDGRRARSVLEADGAAEGGAVELWSASKVHGMAGWRIGFLVGDAEVVGRVKALVDHTTAGVWAGIQEGLLAVLADPGEDPEARRRVYRRRRDVLIGGLREAGVDIALPEGSFYAWWRLPDGVTPERVLSEQRVAIAPGEGFGASGTGWARLSTAVDDAVLEEGVRRLAAAL